MTPPTSIDGTDITGATIDDTDVQEITVDGQTVFTAIDIPNSVVSQSDHWWAMVEGSGQTLADSVGGVDISLDFDRWESDADWIGDAAVDPNDGDEATADSSIDTPNEFTLFGSLKLASQQATLMGDFVTGDRTGAQKLLQRRETGPDGHRFFVFNGSNDDDITLTPGEISVGDYYAFFAQYDGSAATELELYLVEADGTEHSTSGNASNSLQTATQNFEIFHRSADSRYQDNPVGDMGIAFDSWSSAERQTYLDEQPWYDG